MDVHIGVLDGGTHSGPCGHVCDEVRLCCGKGVFQQRFVANISSEYGDAFFAVFFQQHFEIGFLYRNIVITVDLIDYHDIITPFQQLVCQMTPHKPSSTSHQHLLAALDWRYRILDLLFE